MVRPEIVLELLEQNGGSLNESVTFNLGHVRLMEVFVRNHLTTGQEPISRAGLNAKSTDYGQEWRRGGSRAVGFCFVVFAYNILYEMSSDLFRSTEDFLHKYPDYASSEPAEVESARTMCNMMIAALRILKAEMSKSALVEIVTRICSGPDANVITGGGKVGDEKRTLPAEDFYVGESGIIPPKSKKGTKRSLEETPQDLSERMHVPVLEPVLEPVLAEVKKEKAVPFSSAAMETETEHEFEEPPFCVTPQATLSLPVGASLPLLASLSELTEPEWSDDQDEKNSEL
eukprot:Colp12_sorted_trinity150504_noHs@5341